MCPFTVQQFQNAVVFVWMAAVVPRLAVAGDGCLSDRLQSRGGDKCASGVLVRLSSTQLNIFVCDKSCNRFERYGFW